MHCAKRMSGSETVMHPSHSRSFVLRNACREPVPRVITFLYHTLYVSRAKWRRGWHKLKTLVVTFTILSYVRNFLLIFFIKNCNSIYYIKEMVDEIFSTCLCITIFKVMSASDEDYLRAFLFVTRMGGSPTKNATNGRWLVL